MFTCPRCRKGLIRQTAPAGFFWACPQCHGRAMAVGLLRKALGEEPARRIWSRAFADGEGEAGCACPVCRRAMREVTAADIAAAPLKLDLCQRCGFVWFDGAEYEAISPEPPKPALRPLGEIDLAAMPPEMREKYALTETRRIAEDDLRRNGPMEDWKTIPGLFDLPVELEDLPARQPPWATWGVATIIAAVNLWAFPHLEETILRYGLIPQEAWRDGGLTFLTGFLLHSGAWHLLGNLYFLLVFGRHVENYLGPWRWLALLAAATLGGDGLHILLDPHGGIPCVGASGGISGLLVFYALQFPHARLGLMFGWLGGWITLSARSLFLIWIGLQIMGAGEQMFGLSQVSALAHLGGVGVGVAAWFRWRRLDQKPVPGMLEVRTQ